MSINLDLDLYNNTGADIEANITTQVKADIVENQRDYDCAIYRFKIDISNVPIMNVDDGDPNLSFQLLLDTQTPSGNAQASSLVEYMSSLNPIYSVQDYIDEMNRVFCRAYYDIINTQYTAFADSVSISEDFTLASPTNTITMPTGTGSANCCTTSLFLQNIVFNSGNPNAFYNIDLTNPTGLVCRVASSIQLTPGFNYAFAMHGLIDQSKITNGVLQNNTIYIPVDSFLKFNQAQTNGNWVVSIHASGFNVSYNLTMTVVLTVNRTVTLANVLTFPTLPPSITYNSTGYISWLLHEQYICNKFKFALGLTHQNILKIHKSNSNSQYLQFPVQLLSATLNQILTIQQDLPCIYGICQIEKVLIYSNSISVTRDYTNGDNKSEAIFSLTIPADQVLNFTQAVYDVSQPTWRRYQLLSDGALYFFNLYAGVQYYDGTVEKIYISPNQNMNILVRFQKNDIPRY